MGRPNLRKNDKTNGLLGAKTRGRVANLRKKEKMNGLVGAKTGGGSGAPKEKRENK